jgi:hypothetical protein
LLIKILVIQNITAGINWSNTAVQAVLKQPCPTGGWTGTVQPKHQPITGWTDLSDQVLAGPVQLVTEADWTGLSNPPAGALVGQSVFNQLMSAVHVLYLFHC